MEELMVRGRDCVFWRQVVDAVISYGAWGPS